MPARSSAPKAGVLVGRDDPAAAADRPGALGKAARYRRGPSAAAACPASVPGRRSTRLPDLAAVRDCGDGPGRTRCSWPARRPGGAAAMNSITSVPGRWGREWPRVPSTVHIRDRACSWVLWRIRRARIQSGRIAGDFAIVAGQRSIYRCGRPDANCKSSSSPFAVPSPCHAFLPRRHHAGFPRRGADARPGLPPADRAADRGPFPGAEIYDPLAKHGSRSATTRRPGARSSSTTTGCAARSTCCWPSCPRPRWARPSRCGRPISTGRP